MPVNKNGVMKRIGRYIAASVFGGLTVMLLCAAYTSEAIRRGRQTCAGTEICIKDSLKNRFVTSETILSYIVSSCGNPVGRPVDSLDISHIEKQADAQSAVKKSEVYLTRDGILHIDIIQREPLLRFQKDSTGFYADEEGCLFPLQPTSAARVPVVDGNIPVNADSRYKGRPQSIREQEWTDKIVDLVKYMKDSGIWLGNTAQIHVDRKGDLILVPLLGKEKFLFGQPVSVEDKFRKIGLYYTGILPEKGEGYYSTVDVRYEGRIICRK